jgi:hypothetical protein
MEGMWIYQSLDPKMKAELLAGKYAEYPALRRVFLEGYASEAQSWAQRISEGEVVLPSHLWGQA